MTSTVRVESVVTTANPSTGADVVTATLVASLPCRIKAGGAGGSDVQGVSIPATSDELHFPWDTEGLTPGLRAIVTASKTPALLGRVFRLVGPCVGDQQTAQRWEVESWPMT